MTQTCYPIYPLQEDAALLSNLLWTHDGHGKPTLSKQHLWVRLPGKRLVAGVKLVATHSLGDLRFETSRDNQDGWFVIGRAVVCIMEGDGNKEFVFEWHPVWLDNIRIVVEDPPATSFPQIYNFNAINLLCDDNENESAEESREWHAELPYQALTNVSVSTVQSFAGPASLPIFEKLGLCHESPPRTNRVGVQATDRSVVYRTPLYHAAFSADFALIESLGWDTLGQGRQEDNLLSACHTQGAFPVVVKDGKRITSESGGGSLVVNGRQLRYDDIRLLPELRLSYKYDMRESGFTLTVSWECTKSFLTPEIALLRMPFDLYKSVTSVLGLPDTSGPAGLVGLPVAINSPNYGTMRVTVRETTSSSGVYGRIIPLRAHAELWFDIVAGAAPLANGMFEMQEGSGSIELEFELTKIFPFGNRDKSDLFGWWEMPPFYSFVERENILGDLPNAWLNAISFRPDIGRFANNSVSDSAGCCAFYYADMAAYTPELAPGLRTQDMIRFGAEQLLFESNGLLYSDYKSIPNAVTSAIDCAWLYVASTGDWGWAASVKDRLIEKVNQLFEIEYADTGLVASRYSGVPSDPGYMSASWTDSIRTGHLESYVNAHAYRAYRRAAELLSRLGEAETEETLIAKSEKLKANYAVLFYDEESGQILQWVDVSGGKHGFQSRMHLGAAVALGLLPDELSRRLLTLYLGRLERSGFKAYEYGLPLFLEPVPADCHNNWKGKGVESDGSDQAGVYMNGSITHHQCYYLLQALYKAGMRKEANALFMKLTPLARKGGLSGGLHSGLDWRKPDGTASGYEGLLAEQYHFLLAAVTGYLGLELTIDGLRANGAATENGSDRIVGLKPNFGRRA